MAGGWEPGTWMAARLRGARSTGETEGGRDWGGGVAPGERRSGRAERISVWASGVAPSPVAVARGGRVGGPEESPIAIRQSVGVAGWGVVSNSKKFRLTIENGK